MTNAHRRHLRARLRASSDDADTRHQIAQLDATIQDFAEAGRACSIDPEHYERAVMEEVGRRMKGRKR